MMNLVAVAADKARVELDRDEVAGLLKELHEVMVAVELGLVPDGMVPELTRLMQLLELFDDVALHAPGAGTK